MNFSFALRPMFKLLAKPAQSAMIPALIATLLSGCASTPFNDYHNTTSGNSKEGSKTASNTVVANAATTTVQGTVQESAKTGVAPVAEAQVHKVELPPVKDIRFFESLPEQAADDNKTPAVSNDLLVRIRNGFGMPNLESPLVTEKESWYSAKPDNFKRMVERSSLYLYHVVDALEKRGMPTELALLPFIESAFNPQAFSSAKAAGMWQFIPSTGKDYNLAQNMFRDERRDVTASTNAALDYLNKLHDMFGDWHLALAAYNWGEGSVTRAIEKNRRLGLPTDYLSLNMPAETRNYVPKLQAVKNLIANPENYNIALPEIPNHPYFVSVDMKRDIDVAVAARLANMPVEEFKQLNPAYNRPVIVGATNLPILLPYKNAEAFKKNLAAAIARDVSLASWTSYTVSSRTRLENISQQLSVPVAVLRDVNRIPAGMRLKAGSTILIPKTASNDNDIPMHIADNAVMAIEPDTPDMKKISYQVRKGDTLYSVANRYHVSVTQLKGWNGIKRDARAGQVLVMRVPVGTPAPTMVANAAEKSALPAQTVADTQTISKTVRIVGKNGKVSYVKQTVTVKASAPVTPVLATSKDSKSVVANVKAVPTTNTASGKAAPVAVAKAGSTAKPVKVVVAKGSASAPIKRPIRLAASR
ncbi:transglycosylase SLT domain-containing protein [Ampullimonas aquatilis]|uniref:transglycosylase SLT domain-containing protein n=1 Tax=Ampullimonas aquatilis TaxID=1341549 RepID=UPI003C74C875